MTRTTAAAVGSVLVTMGSGLPVMDIANMGAIAGRDIEGEEV